jgi:hypothetical protein
VCATSKSTSLVPFRNIFDTFNQIPLPKNISPDACSITFHPDLSSHRCRRRNSGLVVEKREAPAQDLIARLQRANLVIERSSTTVLILAVGQTLAAGLGWASLAPAHCEVGPDEGQERDVKISADRGRCGLVAGRNFACGGKNPRGPAHCNRSPSRHQRDHVRARP